MRNEAVYDAIQRLRATGEAGVLATVVGIQGSSPGAVGSKMLVVPGGETVGTVGGGGGAGVWTGWYTQRCLGCCATSGRR